ncbi:MAG: oligosaccharide flippase family protein [Candidatus Kuenenia sp.]|nr:oligosaccharide flippase family protein [Candidatus Kuenenia hertensis]
MVIDEKLKRKPMLFKNIIYNLFGQAFLIILGFTAVKFIHGDLGDDTLGIIFFTTTLNVILSTALNLGICTTIVREVSKHYHAESDYVHNLIRTASLFYWGFFILISFAIFFTAPILVDKWIILKTIDKQTAVFVLRILGIAAIIALPQSVYQSLFNGIQRMEFNNIINVGATGFRQLGVIFILCLDGNLFQVIYWYAASSVIQLMAYIITVAHFFPFKALIPKYSSIVIKRNISFASIMTISTVFGAISNQLDSVIISKYLPIGILGYYIFAKGIISRGNGLTTSVLTASFPSFSSLSYEKDRTGLIAQFRKIYDLISFATVPIYVLILFALSPVLSYIFNVEVAKMLYLPATLLCLGTYLYGLINVQFSFAIAAGKPGISAKAKIYELLFVVPITILLINYFGILGAGLAHVVRMIFYYTYATPLICSKCLEIPVSEIYLRVFRTFILSGLTYGGAWLTLRFINNFSILCLSTAYLISTILFLIGSYKMLSYESRKTMLNYIQVYKFKFTSVFLKESKSWNP